MGASARAGCADARAIPALPAPSARALGDDTDELTGLPRRLARVPGPTTLLESDFDRNDPSRNDGCTPNAMGERSTLETGAKHHSKLQRHRWPRM